jgi:TonB family protein
MWGVHIQNVELPPEEPPESARVPQRFARFMLQQEPVAPPVETALADGSSQSSDETESGDESSSGSDTETSGASREKAVASAGLLGLIGGSGSSENASAAVDFLLDQGLVKELDELLGTQTSLQSGRVGRNRNGGDGSSSGQGLDDLLDFGASGGIDDLIADDAGVQKVNLEKKGNVNIETPQSMRGSETARGQRSAQSVMSVINSQHGRVMYTYNKHLRQDPDLRGKVSVDVTIAANGRVTDVQVIESTIQNADFVRDLLTIVRQLRFPSISEGTLTVNVPFVFNRVQ